MPHFTKKRAGPIVAAMVWEGIKIRARLVAAAVALPAALWLQTGPAAAPFCDNLEGKEVTVSGTIDRMVEAAGVIFFRDRKTACQFCMVTHRNDKGCKTGAQIEVSGKLIKNKFLPDTYDIDRGSKPAGETLSCK